LVRPRSAEWAMAVVGEKGVKGFSDACSWVMEFSGPWKWSGAREVK